MLNPYHQKSSIPAGQQPPRFDVRTVETVLMHSVGRNPLQATHVRSAIGRLKQDVLMPRRDSSLHRRTPGVSILTRQQTKLLIGQVGERFGGRNSSLILRNSYIRKIRRSLEIMDVKRIGFYLPLLNPIAAPLAPQPSRQLRGRPVSRGRGHVLGVTGSTNEQDTEPERDHHRELYAPAHRSSNHR